MSDPLMEVRMVTRETFDAVDAEMLNRPAAAMLAMQAINRCVDDGLLLTPGQARLHGDLGASDAWGRVERCRREEEALRRLIRLWVETRMPQLHAGNALDDIEQRMAWAAAGQPIAEDGDR